MMLVRPLLLLVLAAAVLLPGETVVSVRLEGDRPGWKLGGLMTVEPGTALDPLEIRRTVQNLYDSGRVEQVEVVEEPAPGGIALAFRIRPFPEVRKVAMRCDGCPRPPTVLPGTPCTPELLERIESSVSGALAQKGYLHASVSAACREGTLVVEGRRGERSRIVEVAVEADGEAPGLERLQKLEGKVYRSDRLASDLAVIEKRLRKTRPQARLRRTGTEETPEGIILRVEVRGLQPLDFAAVGGTTGKDLKWLKRSLRGEPVTAAGLSQKADELAERHRALGHAQAEAEITLDEGGERPVVRVDLTPGPRYLLSGIRLSGVEAADGGALLALLPGRAGRPYDAEAARTWQGVLLDELRRQGYLDAEVRGPEAALDAGAGTVELVFRVEEGPVYVPSIVEVLGLPEGFESPALAAREGEPLSPESVQADLEALQSRLDDGGYGNARITVTKESDRLAYLVEPGPRAVVHTLFFSGLWATRPERLWPEVRLRKGDPVSFSRALETQSLLYGTGLFASVDVRTRVEPEDPTHATVILRVEEDTPRSYTYGVGYDTYDGVRVQGGLYHENLFGTRRAAGMEGRYSGKEQQWRLFYREPSFFFIPLPIHVSVYQSQEQRTDFSLEKWGSTVELVRTLGQRAKTLFRYAYEIQDAYDIAPGYPVPREDADKRVSSVGLGYILDARDDPFYPMTGKFFSGTLRYAFPLRAATSHFIKGDVRGATYWSPFRDSTLAVSVRGGLISNRLDDEEIPLGERFFMGGRDTVRAFSRDAVGVEGQTVVDGSPIGGNAYVLINAEWRQRLGSWIGLSLFVDSGQVWRDRHSTDWGDLKAGTGYGMGVFFFSPLGPIRVEYSRKIEPSAWDPEDQWYFGIGVPF